MAIVASLTSLVARVTALAAAFVAWKQARRDFAALARLDDRSLADIGLSRSDLRNAVAHDLHVDPTVILKETVAERRRNQRAATAFQINTSPSVQPTVAPNSLALARSA